MSFRKAKHYGVLWRRAGARGIVWLSVALWAAVLLAGTEFSRPRELLELFGIDQSHFEQLTDGVPWQPSENEILLKIMFRMRDFRLEEIEGWARDDFPWGKKIEDLNALRGEVFRFRGRVVSVEALRPIVEVRERFEIDEYYRCKFLLEDGGRSAVVFAQAVPSKWKRGVPIDHRAGAIGFFLKLGRNETGEPEPVFVARRVAWYPDTRLGNLGMDIGLFDDLRPDGQEEGGPGDPRAGPRPRLRDMRLTARNRECFYQMLAAAGRAEPGELIREAQQELRRSGAESCSVVPLFNEPTRQHGRLVVLSGTAREAVLIQVPDQDVQARFGITHYYQVCLFTDDSQGNPLVFCLRELPDGMPTGRGPQFSEYVTAAGFFFNTWAYHSQRPPENGQSASQWQLAPLMIGRDLVWHPRQPTSRNPVAGAIAAAVFVLVLLGIWLVLWRHSRGDKRFYEHTVRRQLAGDSDIAFDRSALEAEDKPDFSGLEEPSPNDPERPDAGS